jgi:glycosyltransferase involved in cell wall biosynthesis
VSAHRVTEVTPEPGGDAKPGLVMLCDVDFGFPDATRTHTVEVARGFALAGLDVDLVARGPDPQLDGVRYTKADGSEEQRLRRLATINAHAIGLLWRRRAVADRFYVRDSWSCLPATVAARLLSYRVVTQVDGIPYGRVAGEAPSALAMLKLVVAIVVGRLSTGLLAVTPQIKELLVELAHVPAERIAVVPNGVDLEFFKPEARSEAIERSGLDQACTYMVFCGGFHAWSDFDLMLEAFALVLGQRPDARLLLVGDGPERDRIERRARELHLQDTVSLTGMVYERERVRDYLGAATVALLAYRGDKVNRTSASPIKLTEYLAAGRAVVAVEIPGVRELLSDTGAGLVIVGEPVAMSTAILELLANGRADVLGAAGRRVAEERLSWRSVIERTLALFGDH